MGKNRKPHKAGPTPISKNKNIICKLKREMWIGTAKLYRNEGYLEYKLFKPQERNSAAIIKRHEERGSPYYTPP